MYALFIIEKKILSLLFKVVFACSATHRECHEIITLVLFDIMSKLFQIKKSIIYKFIKYFIIRKINIFFQSFFHLFFLYTVMLNLCSVRLLHIKRSI